jgi:hypothetical protein
MERKHYCVLFVVRCLCCSFLLLAMLRRYDPEARLVVASGLERVITLVLHAYVMTVRGLFNTALLFLDRIESPSAAVALFVEHMIPFLRAYCTSRILLQVPLDKSNSASSSSSPVPPSDDTITQLVVWRDQLASNVPLFSPNDGRFECVSVCMLII